jgi:hypothetical protein
VIFAVRAAVLTAVIAGACSRPHYLGAEMPSPCRERDLEGCLGWMVERDLVAAELGLYDQPHLRRYVQGIADRLAAGSLLAAPPRVLIGDRDGTYATVGGRIVVARPTLERLATEAELAGVIAHEMAHLEGKHTVASLFGPGPDDEWHEMRRDAEAVADERAVVLLERAGYAPVAMARALRSVLLVEDEEHPLRDDRIARVEAIAVGRGGFEGRAELLDGLEGMIVGRDPRLGHRVGDAWVVAALGIALPLDEDDVVRADEDILVVRRDQATFTAYVIGAPWARELISELDEREVATSVHGRVTAGTVVRQARHDDTPLGKLQRAIRATLPQPPAGAHVAILERARGALVLELGGHRVPELAVRAATADELAATDPVRVVIERAPRAGTLGRLGLCRGRLLDDPARQVAGGDPVRCADRTLAPR